MEHEFALKPRTLTTEGIIRNGEVGVVESPGPTCAYIPNSAVTGNQFRLLNTSDHTVEVRVQDDAFPLELVDADPTDTIDVPIGSMFFAVAGWSKVHNQFQLFATVTSATSGGDPTPQPGGPWMPVNNPVFTGELRDGGYAFIVGNQRFQAMVANTAHIRAGMTTVEGGSSGLNLLSSGNVNAAGNEVKVKAKFGVSLVTDAGYEDHGGLSLNAELSNLYNSTGAARVDGGERVELMGPLITATTHPRIERPLAASELLDNQLVTKANVAELAGGGAPSGDYLPVNNPAFTGNMTGDAITLKHPMGDSQLALTYSNVSGGNLDTVIVDSKLTSLTAQDMVLRAQAGDNGPGTIVMRADNSIEMSASGWRLDNGPQSDLIAAMTPYEIVFGDPNTGYQDNPVVNVHGDMLIAANPKVRNPTPTS